MIPPENEHPEKSTPIALDGQHHPREFLVALTDEREKNEYNLINLVEMEPHKPPDPKHIIEYDQELL